MDWIAFLAALPALITSLGDHLPGLLVAGVALYYCARREKEHAAEASKRLAECQECEKEQRALADKAVTAIHTVSERMAAYERDLEISAQIAGLVADRKLREGHANANRPGQD